MSYLKFDRISMSNLEESLNREILRTNRKGAYHCSTILGCNTRKYHGMLVVPIPELNPHGHVLLSSIDETVIQHGAKFNLSVHKYMDGTFSPNGHKYIREYNIDVIPRTLYRVGGVILSKEVAFSFRDNRILIRYTLLDAHSETTLRFKPFLAFRNVKELTHENNAIDWRVQEEQNGISMCLYAGYPRLYMQYSKPVGWHSQPCWYKGLMYDKERERGHECTEDLPVPGYFECKIKRGETILFSAGDSPIDTTTIEEVFEEGIAERIPRNSFINCLRTAADQFFFDNGKDSYIIAGFPWFGARARDQFISLTGLTYGIGKPERYHQVMSTAWRTVKHYMTTGDTDPTLEQIEKPDTLLWLINSIHDLSRWIGLEETRRLYGEIVEEAIQYIRDDRHPQMKVRENGLLYAVSRSGEPITWMDATIDGYPVVNRQGYIVEFNALWYNALCFYREMFPEQSQNLDDYIVRVAESFVLIFVNKHDYLFDYVGEGLPTDWSVRPNMLFAVGLSYSPLSKQLQRSVLDIVTKELLTPKGLRTLSPVSPFYRAYCNGTLNERAYSSFQGAVWPWLMYPYLYAYLKLFRRSGLSFVERVLIPFEDELSMHGLSTISEMYDGTPPFKGRSAISFATSISSVLRIQNRLEAYYKSGDEIDLFDLH